MNQCCKRIFKSGGIFRGNPCKKPAKVLTACLMATLLSSCESLGSASCLQFTAVYISAQDQLTDSTARQILANNEVGKDQCGWKPTK